MILPNVYRVKRVYLQFGIIEQRKKISRLPSKSSDMTCCFSSSETTTHSFSGSPDYFVAEFGGNDLQFYRSSSLQPYSRLYPTFTRQQRSIAGALAD